MLFGIAWKKTFKHFFKKVDLDLCCFLKKKQMLRIRL